MAKRETMRVTTIDDVAVRAGVSPATVSRVMNGNNTVAPAIAARVRAVAETLNYSPSPAARSLALGRTSSIAFLAPDLGNPTFHGVMRGVSRGAAERSYRVFVVESSEDANEESALAMAARRNSDGLVLCAPRMPEDELSDLVSRLSPVVLINRASTSQATRVVAADYQAGIHRLARHLYDLGHRDLLFLEGPAGSAANSSRRQGLQEFAVSHPDVNLHYAQAGSSFSDGAAAAEDVLGAGVTGVLAFNDLVAMGLLRALREEDVEVPRDISITGFDDIPSAQHSTPPLTTASVPADEIGRMAWSRLWSQLRGEVPEPDGLLAPELKVRGTTGPPHHPLVHAAHDADGLSGS